MTHTASCGLGGLPGHSNLVQRLVASAFPLGVGARGHEVALAETGDVSEVGNGRLIVRLRGRNPRLVPVRACCTNNVRRAINLAEEGQQGASTRFFSDGRPRCTGSYRQQNLNRGHDPAGCGVLATPGWTHTWLLARPCRISRSSPGRCRCKRWTTCSPTPKASSTPSRP